LKLFIAACGITDNKGKYVELERSYENVSFWKWFYTRTTQWVSWIMTCLKEGIK
jgi:hypothetical protein